jgi:hypothetical protein
LEDAFCAFAVRASTLDDQLVETIALTMAQRGDAICSICGAPIRAHVIAALRVIGAGGAFCPYLVAFSLPVQPSLAVQHD